MNGHLPYTAIFHWKIWWLLKASSTVTIWRKDLNIFKPHDVSPIDHHGGLKLLSWQDLSPLGIPHSFRYGDNPYYRFQLRDINWRIRELLQDYSLFLVANGRFCNMSYEVNTAQWNNTHSRYICMPSYSSPWLITEMQLVKGNLPQIHLKRVLQVLFYTPM